GRVAGTGVIRAGVARSACLARAASLRLRRRRDDPVPRAVDGRVAGRAERRLDLAGSSLLEPSTRHPGRLRPGAQLAAGRDCSQTALRSATAVRSARLPGTATGPTSDSASPMSGAVAIGPTAAAANTAGDTCSARLGMRSVSQASPVANVGASAKPTTAYITGAIGALRAPSRARTATDRPVTSTFPGANLAVRAAATSLPTVRAPQYAPGIAAASARPNDGVRCSV